VQEAFTCSARELKDVGAVLLDVELAGGDGRDIASHVLELYPWVRVGIWSSSSKKLRGVDFCPTFLKVSDYDPLKAFLSALRCSSVRQATFSISAIEWDILRRQIYEEGVESDVKSVGEAVIAAT
jgi:hypothetical protein